MNDCGWDSLITRDHIAVILNAYVQDGGRWRFKSWKPNQWTPRIRLLNDVPFVSGLQVDFNSGAILNPTKPVKYRVDFTKAEIREARRLLRVGREKYLPYATLHANSLRTGSNPFEGAALPPVVGLNDLAEEASAEVYLGLLKYGAIRYYWRAHPELQLRSAFQKLKRNAYSEHLVEA